METDVVVNADNLDYLKYLPDNSIDCIYCDPPFNTGDSWAGLDGGFVDIFKEPVLYPKGFAWLDDCIDDTLSLSYISYMAHRLLQIHRVLKSTGHFFLHCDYRESGNLRVLGDSIFGKPNFKNEIIWLS